MTTCCDLPEVRINVAGNHDDIRELLHKIKPAWKNDEMQIKVLSGGYSCNLFHCYCESSPEDAVTVRVRRLLTKSNAPHASPEFELKTLRELSRLGRFPPLLAVFENGYCYQYIQGCPIDQHNIAEPVVLTDNIIGLIARELASIHLVVLPGVDFKQTTYFSNMAALLNNDKLVWKDDWPSQDELLREVEVIRDYVEASLSSPLVLCHGDFHAKNIVWNKELDKVTLVDWELAYVGHRACDIAYFLNVFEYVDFLRGVVHEPTPNLERLFCEYYLQRIDEIRLNDNSKATITKDDMHQLLREVKHFKLVVIFQWLIYIVAFWETTKKLGSDTDRLVKYNIERYLKTKKELIGIDRFGR